MGFTQAIVNGMLIVTMTLIIYIFIGGIESIFICNDYGEIKNHKLHLMFMSLTFVIWSMEYSLLVLYFFVMLVDTFSASADKTSKCTRKIFYFVFAFSIFIEIAIILNWAIDFEDKYWSDSIAHVIVCACLLFLMIQSSTIMVSKLVRCHRKLDGNVDKNMINVATKIVLLNAVCVLSFFMSLAYKGIIEKYGGIQRNAHAYLYLKIGTRILWSLDTFINFSTVYLSFGFSNMCYMRMCGLMHSCCRRACANIMISVPEREMATVISLEVNVRNQRTTTKNTAEIDG